MFIAVLYDITYVLVCRETMTTRKEMDFFRNLYIGITQD